MERRAQDLSFHLFSLGLGFGFDGPKGGGESETGVGAVLLRCLSGLATVDWMLAHGRSFELAFYWDGLVEYSRAQGGDSERSGLLLARDSYQQQLLAQRARARLRLPESGVSSSTTSSSNRNGASSLVEVVRRHAVVSTFFSIVGEPGTAIDFGEQAIELFNTPQSVVGGATHTECP